MARLPYADLRGPSRAALVDEIVEQRGSVLHLYQMLLHSPPVAKGWLEFLTAIRQRCTLSGHLRELVIMRIAALNGAAYEADQHAPIARSEGVSEGQLNELEDWQTSSLFSELERAVLELTDEMTMRVHVSDPVFRSVRSLLNDQEMVELIATIAAYNMVSRFLEALSIQPLDER
jgi:AhpD family alkylhydroperoxidase